MGLSDPDTITEAVSACGWVVPEKCAWHKPLLFFMQGMQVFLFHIFFNEHSYCFCWGKSSVCLLKYLRGEMKHKIFLLHLRISSSNRYFSDSLLFSIINAKPASNDALQSLSKSVLTLMKVLGAGVDGQNSVTHSSFWSRSRMCCGAVLELLLLLPRGIDRYRAVFLSSLQCLHGKPQCMTWPTRLGIQLLICFTAWNLLIYICFSARKLYSQWGRNKFWQDWKQENRSKCSDLSLKLGLLFIWSTFLCMEWRRRSVFWGKATLWISAKEFCRSFAMSYVVWRI